MFYVVKRGFKEQRYDSSSIRRFKNHISTIKWQNQDFKVYLKVNYGKGFHNDGFYQSKEELLFALDAFTESSIYTN
jgi:hypothetical protein